MLCPAVTMPALIVLVLLRQLRVMPAPALFRERCASMTVRQTCLTRAMTHAHRIRFHVKAQPLRLLVMERR